MNQGCTVIEGTKVGVEILLHHWWLIKVHSKGEMTLLFIIFIKRELQHCQIKFRKDLEPGLLFPMFRSNLRS